MLRHHVGSGRRPVIPATWSSHHRGVVEATQTATVTGRREGATQGPLDPETGKRETVPHAPHYTGPARVQVLASDRDVDAAGQQLSTRTYLVTVTLTSSDEWKVDDLVKVTAVDDNGDPSLVGRDLTVTSIARGSLVWERVLTCTDDLG